MNNQSTNWKDPLYLESFLSEEEKNILITSKEFCKEKLLPRVIEDNSNKFFDKNLYLLKFH